MKWQNRNRMKRRASEGERERGEGAQQNTMAKQDTHVSQASTRTTHKYYSVVMMMMTNLCDCKVIIHNTWPIDDDAFMSKQILVTKVKSF